MDIDIVEKPGNKEYFTANQLKKKCKKNNFQGIHDRFIRDETFVNRMIENGRDENACRQMDALADEDHTHLLTLREYYNYKSNWLPRSNKTGSNTVLGANKQCLPCSNFNEKQKGDQQVLIYFNRSQQWAQSSSTWWNWQGSWWTPHLSDSHDGDARSLE